MRFLLFLLTLVTAGGLAAQVDAATIYHRARILYSDPADLQALQVRGVSVDHGIDKAGVYFESDFSEAELAAVRAAGLDYRVVIEDVSAHYVHQNTPGHAAYVAPAPPAKNADCGAPGGGPDVVTPTNYHGGSMGGFLTYAELLTELDEMYAYSEANGLGIITPRADNVNPADVADFRTAEGRYQQWVRISDQAAVPDDAEPEILYTALHHAREPASMQQLVYYMWYLLENYGTDPAVTAIVDQTELYFIPCVNPDGYVYNETTNPNGGGLWRKNRRGGYGVDLNRNYDYVTPQGEHVWNTAGVSSQPSGQTYPGTAAFSEPETRAVRYFVEQHAFGVALNNHTSGGLLLYPFGYDYDRFTPDHGYFEQLSAEMVRDNGYANIISSELYPASGDSDDFMYGYLTTTDGGTRERVLAMTPEIGPRFWPALNQIEDICREMVAHNLTAAGVLNDYGVLRFAGNRNLFMTNATTTYELTQLGAGAGNFAVYVEPLTDNLTGVDTVRHQLTAREATVTGQLGLRLAEDIVGGDLVRYNLVVDNGRYLRRTPVVQTYGWYEDAVTEAGESLAGWTTDSWAVTTADHAPGSPNSCLTDSPGENYANLASAPLLLDAPVDLTDAGLADATLTFYARWDIEANYDQVRVQVSTDGGASWASQCGDYTRPGVATHLTPGEPLYDGRQDEWVLETIGLSDYLGETIRVRFLLESDGGVVADGFYLDDLRVSKLRRTTVGTTEPLVATVAVSPNPATDVLRLAVDLAAFTYRMTDAAGRTLRRGSGAGTAVLNVADLAAGTYWITVAAGGRATTLPVVVH